MFSENFLGFSPKKLGLPQSMTEVLKFYFFFSPNSLAPSSIGLYENLRQVLIYYKPSVRSVQENPKDKYFPVQTDQEVNKEVIIRLIAFKELFVLRGSSLDLRTSFYP